MLCEQKDVFVLCAIAESIATIRLWVVRTKGRVRVVRTKERVRVARTKERARAVRTTKNVVGLFEQKKIRVNSPGLVPNGVADNPLRRCF